MVTICEIIPDLGNGQSRLKGVFDKISEQIGFAFSQMENEGITQTWDYRDFEGEHGIKPLVRHFLVVIT